jgi:hypothetical protein
MHPIKPISTEQDSVRPRHPHEEIADLLAVALLRLRAKPSARSEVEKSCDKDPVGLGFTGHQRVNANPDQQTGLRP